MGDQRLLDALEIETGFLPGHPSRIARDQRLLDALEIETRSRAMSRARRRSDQRLLDALEIETRRAVGAHGGGNVGSEAARLP